MAVALEIIPIPIGSQQVRSIGNDDPADLNDFRVLLLFDENATGLTATDVTVTVVDSRNRPLSGVSVVSVEGANSVWIATIRPPRRQTADAFTGSVRTAVATVTVAANAVTEGNPRTSKDIRLSTRFPDADAETPTHLFDTNLSSPAGIAATPTRLLVMNGKTLHKFTYSGREQTSERITFSGSRSGAFSLNPAPLDYINGDILVGATRFNLGGRFNLQNFDPIFRYNHFTRSGVVREGSIFATRLGIAFQQANRRDLRILPWGTTEVSGVVDHEDVLVNSGRLITEQDDLLFALSTTSYNTYELLEITADDTFRSIKDLNINGNNQHSDISIYRDTLYILFRNGDIQTLDIKKYRPMAKNTKTTLYPVFANAGDTIDLTQYAPDAERIVFDVGFDKPPYLSINASNELVVGSGAETCLVKLKAINRIDATETGRFGFYLIIRQAAPPVWREVSELTMRAGSSYDLFQLVSDATSIEFRAGFPRPAGSRLSNGVFTVGSVGGTVHFTARNSNGIAHIKINIDVVQGIGSGTPADSADVFRYRVEIAGNLDVTPDLLGFPSVSETLDPVVINEYRVNEASIVLRNEKGKYNNDMTGNFWETNGLNAGGFQNAVKIYTEHLESRGTWIRNLLFSGLILESFEPMGEATFKLNCVDISSRLRKALVQDFGTLQKWDALRKQSDEDSFEGVYVPEGSLLPMQTRTGKARSGRTDLHISRLELPSEGPAPANTGYMTPTEFRTAGGFLDENPLLRFKAEHRSEDVRFLINQLAINKEVYNTEIDIPGVEVAEPFLLNRGSVAFSVEPTRTTRLPVDWVIGVESGLRTPPTILILLSNPEQHISDLLVQYDMAGDRYRTLRTFDKNIAVHRIARRNSTNHYILTAAKITQDRSAQAFPRPTDRTGYAFDSLAQGSAIQIHHYNTNTGTLTEHVAEDDSFPPQLGIHYHVGFENELYVDEFEGILPSPYSAFKVFGSDLYYRYAKAGEFGVARVNTSRTTTKMIGQAVGTYQNHLNFAFDINSSGTLYFVYATGEADSSTLTIKRRTSDGTLTTVLSETRGVGDFNELGFDFGAFLGCHEALFHNNLLYMLVPIQKVDFGDDTQSVVNPDVNIEQRTAEKSGERNVTTHTNVNPSSIILAPGEDIPLRIDFDSLVSGATQDDLTVYGGTIQSFSISSDMIDVTIRPNSKTRHKTIIIDLAEDAVDQTNEAWRITIDFETERSRAKSAGAVLYRCDVTARNPSLTVVDTWDFVHLAGCNLTVHDGNVHYAEHPPASRKFKPYNPDL